MNRCPVCGQPIPQNVKIADEISLDDPMLSDTLTEFSKNLGLSIPAQRKLHRELSAYSARAVKHALDVFRVRNIYGNDEITNKVRYFVGIVRKKNSELQKELETVGTRSLDFDPDEFVE